MPQEQQRLADEWLHRYLKHQIETRNFEPTNVPTQLWAVFITNQALFDDILSWLNVTTQTEADADKYTSDFVQGIAAQMVEDLVELMQPPIPKDDDPFASYLDE